MKKSTLQFIVITAFIFLILVIWTSLSFGQTTQQYKGQQYEVLTGPKGGKYIQPNDSTKIYLSGSSSWDKPVDNGNGTATYKKVVYPIQVGPKGGRYIITTTGKKYYLPKVVN